VTDNEAKLQTAFRQALDLGPEIDVTSLTYRAIREWDSVAHMQLISAIETTFDLMLDTDDVIAMASYVKAREIVARHGVVL
jgi:acyl carrier protein